MSSTEHGAPLLRVTGMTKDFPGLRALDDVSLEVAAGEIVAVLGHNGSGKSTLVKVLAGVHSMDAGAVDFPASRPGEETELHIIHQDLGLCAPMSAVENLGIADRTGPSRWLPIRSTRELDRAVRLISGFGAPFDVTVPVARLSPAQRSIVAIARALDGWRHPRNVLILDEPTEALHASEVRVLFDAVTRLAAEGAGIIFISHRLDEVLELADRVVVLRDGRTVADEPRSAIDHDRLVEHVTGIRASEAERGRDGRTTGEVVLEIEGLQGAGVEGLDLVLRRGEVVGIAGVLGSGREALPALVFGSLDSQARTFRLDGEPYADRSPHASIRRGMAFVPGDRGRHGAVRDMTARENTTLPELRSLTNAVGAIRVGEERQHVMGLMRRYDVRPPRTEQTFAQFSGGNQQKIVFARWLRNSPRVLLLEEPTQGVDIGAKQALYGAIDVAAESGAGVIVCSSEAKELVRLCDRVVVMRGGRVAAVLAGEHLTETRIVFEGYGLASEAVW